MSNLIGSDIFEIIDISDHINRPVMAVDRRQMRLAVTAIFCIWRSLKGEYFHFVDHRLRNKQLVCASH